MDIRRTPCPHHTLGSSSSFVSVSSLKSANHKTNSGCFSPVSDFPNSRCFLMSNLWQKRNPFSPFPLWHNSSLSLPVMLKVLKVFRHVSSQDVFLFVFFFFLDEKKCSKSSSLNLFSYIMFSKFLIILVGLFCLFSNESPFFFKCRASDLTQCSNEDLTHTEQSWKITSCGLHNTCVIRCQYKTSCGFSCFLYNILLFVIFNTKIVCPYRPFTGFVCCSAVKIKLVLLSQNLNWM